VSQVEGKITDRTFAIVPVHLYGQCADMEPLLKIAQKHNLHVIEDAAQALGAEYTFSDGGTRRAGTMGTIGCTSFFPSKNLGCFGDGGAIFTQDSSHDVIGVNSRLDTLQAAILNVKLKYLDEYKYRRNEVAAFYDRELSSLPFLEVPFRSSNSSHTFHQYSIKMIGVDRDQFKAYLESKGIPGMIYYPVPLHLQKAYSRSEYPVGSFKITEQLSRVVVSLPIHTEMKMGQLSYICDTIKAFPANG
jgi:UDP-2-acetamido-2-deoxy-ribo-hexuluronate aminotransferase